MLARIMEDCNTEQCSVSNAHCSVSILNKALYITRMEEDLTIAVGNG